MVMFLFVYNTVKLCAQFDIVISFRSKKSVHTWMHGSWYEPLNTSKQGPMGFAFLFCKKSKWEHWQIYQRHIPVEEACQFQSSLHCQMLQWAEQTKIIKWAKSGIQTMFMVKEPDSKYCPVLSFLKYTSHLSPLMSNFWIYAKDKGWQDSEVWYINDSVIIYVKNVTLSRIEPNLHWSQY